MCWLHFRAFIKYLHSYTVVCRCGCFVIIHAVPEEKEKTLSQCKKNKRSVVAVAASSRLFLEPKKKNKNTQTHFACIMQMPFVLSQLSSKLLFSFRCLFIRIDDVVRVGSVPARNSIRICTCKIWFWFSIAVYSSFTVISAVIRTGIICEWQIKRRFSLSRSIDERSRLTENKRQTKLTHLLNVLSVFFFKSFVK